jgi:glucoamylase
MYCQLISARLRTYGVCMLALASVGLLAVIAPVSRAGTLDQWLQTEKTTATTRLLANVQSNGAVLASPQTANPPYNFHWVRDAALTMNVLATLYAQASDPNDRQNYWNLLSAYVEFSLNNQTITNPSSAFGRGLGEPKFNPDGSAYTGSWRRPQDDGPALRAITCIRLANYLLDNGDATQVALVKSKLYDSTLPTNSLIKRDLEYVSHNWQLTCFDLWEEVSGHHFYTRMAQRRALVEGTKLARRLADGGAADWYTQQVAALEPALRAHWDATNRLIIPTLDRDDGLDYKASNIDSAVILAVLHTQAPGDSFFGPADDAVFASVAKLLSAFPASLYAINGVASSPDGNALGTAIGRYPEDRYDGSSGNQGNPWVLCTAAVAEWCYRAANELDRTGQFTVTNVNKPLLVLLNATRFNGLQPGQLLSRSDQAFTDILSELRTAGDRQLARIKYHSYPDGGLSEQMNRTTGFMQSARDLTWNYACFLTTLANRTPGTPALLTLTRRAIPLEPRGTRTAPSSPSSAFAGVLPRDKGIQKAVLLKTQPNGVPARLEKPGGAPTLDELSMRLKKLEDAVDSLAREIRALRAMHEKPGGR